ncbi:MAG: energy transducer TonB [Nitrospirae bacterium]|nr:energy transducer TonB [Nitrospirota bacterium]
MPMNEAFNFFRSGLTQSEIPVAEQTEVSESEKKRPRSRELWVATIATLTLHGTVALFLILGANHKNTPQTIRPLEVTWVSLSPPFPPPARQLKRTRSTDTEIKPVQSDVHPTLTPVSEIQQKIDEFPVTIVPRQEEALQEGVSFEKTSIASAPAETEIVLPEYHAVYLNNRPPSYPPVARRMNIEGTVRLRALINPLGMPEQIELKVSSGSSLLNDAALNAVRNWSFIPARKGSEPVSAWVEIPINFNLKQ